MKISSSTLFTLLLLLTTATNTATSFSTLTSPPPIPSVLDIPPPAALPSSVADDLATDGVAVVPNYACKDTINLLRFDALRLRHAGMTHTAGTKGDNDEVRADNNNNNSNNNNNNSNNANASANVVSNNNHNPKRKNASPLRKCNHFWLVDRDSESGRPYLGPSYISDLVSTIEDEVDGTSPFSYDDCESSELLASSSLSLSSSSSSLSSSSLSSSEEMGMMSGKRDNYYDDGDGHSIHRQETEAAYLYYDKGGYYDWHFDTPSERKPTTTTSNPACDSNTNKHNNNNNKNYDDKDEINNEDETHRRAFSFLLYLGGHEPHPHTGEVRPWDADIDGGELRVYPSISLDDQHRRIHGIPKGGNIDGVGVGLSNDVNNVDARDSQSGGNNSKGNSNSDGCSGLVGDPTGQTDYMDIVPQEGTLVIFKSEAICHQVLATNRERLVVVGWIHGDLK